MGCNYVFLSLISAPGTPSLIFDKKKSCMQCSDISVAEVPRLNSYKRYLQLTIIKFPSTNWHPRKCYCYKRHEIANLYISSHFSITAECLNQFYISWNELFVIYVVQYWNNKKEQHQISIMPTRLIPALNISVNKIDLMILISIFTSPRNKCRMP